MKAYLHSFIKANYRTIFTVVLLALIFKISAKQNFLLFHTIVELSSIVIAFAVFIVTWNTRRMLDNNYLYFVGIAYIFIGGLDLLHMITYPGMHIIPGTIYYTNQFWVATRFLEAFSLMMGFWFLKRKKTLNGDITILSYCIVSLLIILSILYWQIFPVCYVEGKGLTPFKIAAEYVIIAMLFFACFLLYSSKKSFTLSVFRLLMLSLFFAIVSEFCFTLYVSISSFPSEMGHYAKLISFFLIYKANVETGFTRPTDVIFKDLKDNEEKYRTLAENLPELIFRFDRSFRCLYANSALEEFLPHKHVSYAGKKLSHLGFPVSFENLLIRMLIEVRQTRTTREINFDLNEDSYVKSFSIQIIPEYGLENHEETYLVICYDITDFRNTEKRLQELNATKDKFFSIIAHDLRNPFTSLISFSELIYKNVNRLSLEKIENLAFRMNDSAKQAYTLLENLLHWSKMQTGVLEPDLQELNVEDILEEMKNVSSSIAIAKGIEIKIEKVCPDKILADRQMMNTVLRNIIANAIKFSHANGNIVLTAHKHQEAILFAVKDSGIGIEKENIERLFKMDSSFSTPGTQNERGTGLGLRLCREFVEISGGSIWLESEPGLGTTIYFTVPAVNDIPVSKDLD
ncbi:PAS domain S-box-containing protein [Pedobacter cryoconitis]|uniref:sensor histidine kinase n=1 Tax=Pedobacter cryoconitis TaxID=188932 RepID=UPI00161648E7|nr:MASE3 domain-containing protein [Pedobacter cryoconitis]MBB6273925.1 PAS domain S-box-containing protein [Pedobacter cryoconitis]